ncbi:MAG: hypothetical protein K9W43_04690 [Candidatus Thorarchaeota archaeon]|nr:hypothetical protein [Candidatus Thorarchaeota archaeon]
MPIELEIDYESIHKCEETFNITINLTSFQKHNLTRNGKITLDLKQISEITDQVHTDTQECIEFVLEYVERFQPLFLSLYVVNPSTWEIMKRKPDHTDRMLPMVTIPWIYARNTLKTKKNPLGITHSHNDGVKISYDGKRVFFDGSGGDFYGLLEERIAEQTQRARPLFFPGNLMGAELVPVYKKRRIRVIIDQAQPEVKVCPPPRKELDYRFSESPKFIHKYGLEVRSLDQTVQLKIGFDKESPLRGEVLFHLGKVFTEWTPRDLQLGYYIWLNSLAKVLSSK